MTAYLRGLDISRWQEDPVDFPAVRRSGRAFVVTRWSVGNFYFDATGPPRVERVLDAGMVAGVYHVLSAHEDPKVQARRLVSSVRGIFAEKPLVYVLDVERGKTVGNPSAYAASLCLHELRRLTGRVPVAYVPKWYMAEQGWGSDGVRIVSDNGRVPWWHSHYVTSPKLELAPPAYKGWQPLLWQHTSSARVPGITGDVDDNVFYGVPDELLALAGHALDPDHIGGTHGMFTFSGPDKPTIFAEGGRGAALNERTDLATIQNECRAKGVPLPHFSLDKETYASFEMTFPGGRR